MSFCSTGVLLVCFPQCYVMGVVCSCGSVLVILRPSHFYNVRIGIPILLSVGCIQLVLCLPTQCVRARGIVPAPFCHLFSRFAVLVGMFCPLHVSLFPAHCLLTVCWLASVGVIVLRLLHAACSSLGWESVVTVGVIMASISRPRLSGWWFL